MLFACASSLGLRRVPRLGSRHLLGPRLLGDCESLPWRLASHACRAGPWPGLGSVFPHVACFPRSYPFSHNRTIKFSHQDHHDFLFGFGFCFSRTDTTGGQRRETPIAGSLHAGSDQKTKKKFHGSLFNHLKKRGKKGKKGRKGKKE